MQDRKRIDASIIKKIEDFELKFYKKLGVEIFKRLTFKLEKLVHFRDKKKNKNYHIGARDREGLEQFKKYLYYNGFIHVKNLFVLLIVLGLRLILVKNFIIFDLYFLFSIPKNIYCIMLQRYNYIRINRTIEKLEKVKMRKIEKRAVELADREQLLEKLDINVINQVLSFEKKETECVVNASAIESLKALRSIVISNGINETHDKRRTLSK